MHSTRLSLVSAVTFIAALASLGYVLVGPPAALLSVAFVGGLALWLTTTYRTPVEPRTIIVPYMLTVILFIAHVYEEYLAHIELTFSKIFPVTVSQMDFLTVAAFAAPLVWLAGATMMLMRWPFGYFFASTFLFGMMFGEVSHFAFPFMEDGTFHYSAGMYTALLPAISAWYTFAVLRRGMAETRVTLQAAPAHQAERQGLP
jgi:hypothetical protein